MASLAHPFVRQSSRELADILVIGAGMWGSAAARHLKELRPSLKVWLVGPDESTARESHAFSQHADEGRITRRIDQDPVWASLAARSIERYAEIEKASGISFHSPLGFLAVGHAEGPFVRRAEEVGRNQGMPLRGPLDHNTLQKEYPYFDFGFENVGYFEDGAQSGSGLISPRALVRAQLALFQRAGGISFNDVVEQVDYHTCDTDSDKLFLEAKLSSGRILTAHRILVATGSLMRWKKFLPKDPGHIYLDTTVVTQEVVRVAIGDDSLDRLAGMPCTVCKFGNAAFGTATSFDSCYILPPIPYPEEELGASDAEHIASSSSVGESRYHYLKIGHGTWFERKLPSYDAALAWLNGHSEAGSRDGVTARDALCEMLDRILPGLQADSSRIVVDRCAWDTTPSMRPYIGTLPGGCVGFCAGGNGFAAKSSDEIGRIAAMMMLGAVDGSGWTYDIPQEMFTPIFQET